MKRCQQACPIGVGCRTLAVQIRRQADASGYAGAGSDAGGRRVGRGYENPLAARDPALRSVTLPESFHGSKANRQDVSSVVDAETIQRRARLALMKQLDSNLLWRGTVVKDTTHWVSQHFLKCKTDPKYRRARERMILTGKHMMRELAEMTGTFPRTLLVAEGKPVPSWLGGGGDHGPSGKEGGDSDAHDDPGAAPLSSSHEQILTPSGEPCEIVRVSQRLADEIDAANDGYIGDYAMPAPPLIEDLIANTSRHERVLVLDNVTDPGQLGTMLRTAAALSYDAVLMVNHCADYYDHAVVRASRGVHFLPHAPFYVIRDEDGDDAYGLINHIMKRNNMESVAFTPNPSSHWGVSTTAPNGANAAAHSPFAAARELLRRDSPQKTPTAASSSPLSSGSTSLLSSLESNVQATKRTAVAARLSTFLLDTFATKPGTVKATSEEKRGTDGKSFMIFAGPDRTNTLIPTLERKVARPTIVLQLDEQQDATIGGACFPDDALAIADFTTTFPTVLYAMRPKGDWDYLTPAEREETALAGKGGASHSNLVGWEVTKPHQENIDEDEQTESAIDDMMWRVNKRILKRVKTDHGYFVDMEKRIGRHHAVREMKNIQDPLFVFTGEGATYMKKPEPKLSKYVPNIATDYMEHAGRDELAQEMRTHNKQFTNWMDEIDGVEDGGAPTITDIYNQNGKFAYQTPNGTRKSPR